MTRSLIELRLDRMTQWALFKELCATSDKSMVITVVGYAGEDVRLFCQRVEHYLESDCSPSHRVLRLCYSDRSSTAHTVEDWEYLLLETLGRGTANATDALRLATDKAPLLLLLGDGPLSGLEPHEVKALMQFIGDYLPTHIEAARPTRPVRVLVPIEHHLEPADGSRDTLVRDVRRALERTRRIGLATAELPEFDFPGWDEVADYIINEHGDDAQLLRDCRVVYDRNARLPAVKQSVFRLARELDDVIEQHLRRTP